MDNDLNPLPIGDVQFFDNLVPVLGAGNYTIAASQTLDGIATTPIGATQSFVVVAPQVNIDPTDVNTTYPPQNLSGQYGDVLPHIVLNMALLPWERPLDPNDSSLPWMALLIFSPDELPGTADRPTGAIATTVGAFQAAPPANVFRPTLTLDADVLDSTSMNTVQIPAATFNLIAPHKDELKYLAHVRALNMGDKSTAELSGTGVFSVVVANRFPQASATDPLGQQNIAHLVSLEGMADLLTGSANFGDGKDTLELISLFSWTFRTLPDPSADFQGLLQAMVAAEGPAGQQDPTRLWPRLDGSALPAGPAKDRLAAGYVPLSYLTRTGEQTFAWYRGPFAPFLPTEFTQPGQFLTADAAVVYDATNGLFDMSLAAAWQVGRMMALSDKSFGANLLAWRRKTSALIDRIQYVLTVQNLGTPEDLAAAAQSNFFRQQFDSMLQSQLVNQLGQPVNAVHGGGNGAQTTQVLGSLGSGTGDPVQALKTLMADPAIQATVASTTAQELQPVVQWLAQLSLLVGVPFNNLIADARLLPDESIRFFYLDPNWMNAVRDGALSIAQHSSRDTFYTDMVRGIIEDGVDELSALLRSQLLGQDDEPGADDITHVSGFLLRSAIVSGWPGLSVQGLDGGGNPLKVLRQDHLSDNVMLVLFWGSPKTLLLTEPQEGFRFGVNQDGQIALRSLAADSTLGDDLRTTLQIRDMGGADGFLMRPGTQGRVLNLSPGSSSGLVQGIVAANATASLATFGPAAFALQMINAPMRQTFNPPL
jgi:hypothetical protein